MFVAIDARTIDDGEISGFARRLLGQGAVYVCCWGPDCSRVHDLFDLLRVVESIESEDDRFEIFMTTWHDSEPLDEALYFTLFDAFTDDEVNPSPDVLAVVVAKPSWAAHVERRLNDLETLMRDALDPDSG